MEQKKILVIDDDLYIIRIMKFILEKEGYVVYSANNGEEAILKAEEVCPDLCFLDLEMPKKNGYEVCKELKNSDFAKDSYIIILTGRGQDVDIQKGMQCGANEYITKPFSPKEILEKVKSVF